MPTVQDLEQLLQPEFERYQSAITALNDDLAHHPELSGEEFESSAKIVQLLRAQGLAVEYPYGGESTGFRAMIPGRRGQGPRVALLAEYDALPGIGHGCGHCASGSISVFTALMLHALNDQFGGQVDLIGTPDEEVAGGKIRMAQRGIFNGYDLAIMMHMYNQNAVYTPFLALDGIRFEFIGQPAHAAGAPWAGRNALNAVQLLFHASDMMRQHIKDDIRIHGIITRGGEAPNIVPDDAAADFYTRGLLRSELDDVSEWLRDCGRAAAMATRTEVKISACSPPLRNLTRNGPAEALLKELYEHHHLTLADESKLQLGSSDIGEVDDYCPTFHPMIQVKNNVEMHTRELACEMILETGHTAIYNGARILTLFILKALLDAELMQAIQDDYRTRRQ